MSSSKKLSRLALGPGTLDSIAAAARRGVHKLSTVADVLHFSEFELVHLLDVSQAQAAELLEVASQTAAPKCTTALALHHEQSRKISTGVSQLDEALCGGVRCGEITEVAGTPGSGKTQFCLSLACFAVVNRTKKEHGKTSSDGGNEPPQKTLTSQTDSLSGVVYFDTEGMFNAGRVRGIARARFGRAMMGGTVPTFAGTDEDEALDALLSRIFVFRIHSLKEFLHELGILEHSFLIENPTNLIVVDSIPSLIEKEAIGIQQRQQTLGEIAARLKYLAESFGVAVVATNHVVTAFHSHLQSRSSAGGAPFLRSVVHRPANGVTPGCSGGGLLDLFDDDDDPAAVALGNTWSHCVNTRFVIAATSRFDQLPGLDHGDDHGTRDKPVLLSVHKSPLLGPCAFACAIGVHGFSGRGQFQKV